MKGFFAYTIFCYCYHGIENKKFEEGKKNLKFIILTVKKTFLLLDEEGGLYAYQLVLLIYSIYGAAVFRLKCSKNSLKDCCGVLSEFAKQSPQLRRLLFFSNVYMVKGWAAPLHSLLWCGSELNLRQHDILI